MTVATIVCFTMFGTQFQNEGDGISRWFYFYYAATYLAYRLLDEMDGKQARRIKASSPLGLLFDHGCDAFTMGFAAIVATKCF